MRVSPLSEQSCRRGFLHELDGCKGQYVDRTFWLLINLEVMVSFGEILFSVKLMNQLIVN